MGEPDEYTGFVMDLKKLSKLIVEKIIDRVDHKNLNVDVDFMKNIMPSTENLAIKIWEILEPYIMSERCYLYCIKLFETDNNYVEYYGPNGSPNG